MLKRQKIFLVLLHTLLLFCIWMSGCNGQDKKSLRQLQVLDPTEISDSLSKSQWVDPLFFIEGQLSAWVRNIYQDKQGNLWFGTNHYGVMRHNGDSLEFIDDHNGLGKGRINDILEDDAGNVWLATHGGLTRFDGQSFANFPVNNAGGIEDEVFSVHIDRAGMFWVGTLDGVMQFDGQNHTPFSIPKAVVNDTSSILSYDRISCILEDRTGTLWFGTDGFGICKYDPIAARAGSDPFTLIAKKDGLPDNNVADLMEDSRGNVWIGTMYGGMSRYDPSTNSFTNFTQEGVIDGEEAYGLFEDKNGHIWFAAEHVGVFRCDPAAEKNGKEEFTKFNKKHGLESLGIISIFEDRNGRMWLGGWGGLFRFDAQAKDSGKLFYSVTKDGPWH